jgi:UDP-glucose 4-epimerase
MEGVRLSRYKALITGGAGFVGNHLVDNLMNKGWHVTVFDNLSSGSLKNIRKWLQNKQFKFVKGDLKNPVDARKAMKDVELVFHFAANPEVPVGETDPSIHFEDNLLATFNLLEAMRKSRNAKTLIFASTSTIYGEASVIPTPEEYGPLAPISLYGASKLGSEALACSYAHTFGIRTLILRLANVVGSRSKHGVIVDFIKKLQTSPKKLTILGNGTQTKSYLHIDDCINAIQHLTTQFLESEKRVDIYNIGAFDQIDVKRIAEIVTDQMKLTDVKFTFTGGVDGGRGWLGDVKTMQLLIKKLREAGWRPKYNSEQAVKLATKALLKELKSNEGYQ